MANINSTGFGLKPVDLVGSSANSTGATKYYIKSDAAAMYQGSPVIATDDGTIAITGAATGDTYKHIGAFAGCEYVDATTKEPKFSNFWPGSGSADTNYDIVAYVYDNPFQKFLVVADGSVTNKATARGLIFENVEFALGTSGSTVTGVSSAVFDADGTIDDTDTSLPMKIVGIYDQPDSQTYDEVGIVFIVTLNNHALLQADSTGTVA